MIETIDLLINQINRLYVLTSSLDPLKEELEKFLEDTNMKESKEVLSDLFSEEIKANDLVEGYRDDIDDIINVNKKKKNGINSKEQRILNLYNGYKYISKTEEINKENLKKLYNILSRNLLSKNDLNLMGDYYRNDSVYIYYSNNINFLHDEGINCNEIDKYMNYLFDYINNGDKFSTMTDYYIKSQIMHFYFVFIHPYFDVNGRTSRTMSMWYLLNNEIYPYIIFNRGINFDKNTYYKAILETKKFGNITIFLKYMLKTVKKELEKEYLISNVSEIKTLTQVEKQTLNYVLSMKGIRTLKDFTKYYNYFNEKRTVKDVNENLLNSLIDKDIIQIIRYSNSKIYDGSNNYIFQINDKYLDKDPEKIKRIKL